MKYYGRDGRMKPEKKKKRKFEVIRNTGTQGIYSDFTPMKVAKKVTSELVGKKKQIIFHLREKGKSGKTYGPYIGNIKDGKVVVRIHKMSGGEMGCVFNRITPNNFKVDKKDIDNPPNIAITNFCVTKATIILFVIDSFLEKDGNKYYTYVIYREWNNVLVKRLDKVNDELIATPIKIEDIALSNIFQRRRILDEIKKAIETKRIELKKENFAEKIYKEINTYLSTQPQQSFSQIPINKTPQIVINRQLKKTINQFKMNNSSLRSVLLQPQQKMNETNNLTKSYICPITNPIIEVKRNDSANEIFFGFDPNLLFQSTFYYKYSYRGDGNFYQLLRDQNGTLIESKIEISQIPLYDLLCLYEFAKKNSSLRDLNKNILEYIEKNPNVTISLSNHPFMTLSNSNFNKKRNTNIGKTKRKTEISKNKTYYFFGKLGKKFKYVCFREGEGNNENVYYYEQNNLKVRKQLSELKDRDALEELKSFIILRQIKEPDFGGEFVCKIAGEIISKLKAEEITRIQTGIQPGIQTQIPNLQYNLTAHPQIQNPLQKIITTSALPTSPKSIKDF